MNSKSIARACSVGAILACLTLVSAEPTTKPARDGRNGPTVTDSAGASTTGGSNDRDRGGDRDQRGERPRPPGGGWDRDRAPSPQERDDAIAFFREHTKNHIAQYEQMQEGRFKNRVTQFMVERYRRLNRMQQEDPEVYGLVVEQLQLTDELAPIIRESSGQVSDDVRKKVLRLVNLSLDERTQRLAKLEKMLTEQKAKLEQDMKDPESLVEQQIKRMREDPPDPRRRFGDGMGGSGAGRGDSNNVPATQPSDKPDKR